VDANMARMISSQVALFAALFLFTQINLFLFIIIFDFIVRAFRKSELSLFSMSAKIILSVLGAAPRPCDESPKRFALYLGLGTALAALGLFSTGFVAAAAVIAVILLSCALLEALFDFCIGCRIYYAIQLTKAKFSNDRNFN
jgi:hypothetical protein